jgi:hypothetical protein
MIRFTPFNEEELVTPSFEPGEYKFKVKELEEKTSSTGKNMLKVTLMVIKNDGRDFNSYDNMFPDHVAWRFYRFLKSIGLGDQYKNGEISYDEIIGKYGRADFQYEEYNGKKHLKPKEYLFLDVKDAEEEIVEQLKDDEIPF